MRPLVSGRDATSSPAAIGAGAGGAAGTGVVLATRGKPAVVAAESVITFRLNAPVTVEMD